MRHNDEETQASFRYVLYHLKLANDEIDRMSNYIKILNVLMLVAFLSLVYLTYINW